MFQQTANMETEKEKMGLLISVFINSNSVLFLQNKRIKIILFAQAAHRIFEILICSSCLALTTEVPQGSLLKSETRDGTRSISNLFKKQMDQMYVHGEGQMGFNCDSCVCTCLP